MNKQAAEISVTYWDASGWRGPWTVKAPSIREARAMIREQHGVKTLRGFTIIPSSKVPDHCK